MGTASRLDRADFGSIAAFVLVGAAACSSSSPAATTSSDAAVSDAAVAAVSDAQSAPDEGSNVDAGAEVSEGGTEAAGGNVTLTVMNFLSWCSVTINGGMASTAASVTASVATGSTATIVATPASSSFTIGDNPWFGVTQDDGGAAPGMDNGSGTTETSTSTVVVTGTQCVSVCCEEPNNSPVPCPATNPCP